MKRILTLLTILVFLIITSSLTSSTKIEINYEFEVKTDEEAFKIVEKYLPDNYDIYIWKENVYKDKHKWNINVTKKTKL